MARLPAGRALGGYVKASCRLVHVVPPTARLLTVALASLIAAVAPHPMRVLEQHHLVSLSGVTVLLLLTGGTH